MGFHVLSICHMVFKYSSNRSGGPFFDFINWSVSVAQDYRCQVGVQ